MKENLGRRAREAIWGGGKVSDAEERWQKGTDLVHLLRNGGGEEESLAGNAVAVGEAVDNLHELASESLLEETVGLVKNERAEVGELGLEVRVLEVIDHASRGTDEDIATLLVEAVRLRVHVGSAYDLRAMAMSAVILPRERVNVRAAHRSWWR